MIVQPGIRQRPAPLVAQGLEQGRGDQHGGDRGQEWPFEDGAIDIVARGEPADEGDDEAPAKRKGCRPADPPSFGHQDERQRGHHHQGGARLPRGTDRFRILPVGEPVEQQPGGHSDEWQQPRPRRPALGVLEAVHRRVSPAPKVPCAALGFKPLAGMVLRVQQGA